MRSVLFLGLCGLGGLVALGLAGCSASGAAPAALDDNLNDGGPADGTFFNPIGTDGGSGNPLGADQCGKNTTGVIRDFKKGEPPDFETIGSGTLWPPHRAMPGEEPELGIVAPVLGTDRKPMYAGNPDTGTITTMGAATFATWFNDTSLNRRSLFSIPFTEQQVQNPSDPTQTISQYSFNTREFFPIDNNEAWGFGNQGDPHNYSFTLEFHTNFDFNGWEVFDFEGDDDVWVFLNGKLAVDIGGIHLPIRRTLDFQKTPELAAQFGLERGKSYTFDFFYAERHTTMSDFLLTTTLTFKDCVTY